MSPDKDVDPLLVLAEVRRDGRGRLSVSSANRSRPESDGVGVDVVLQRVEQVGSSSKGRRVDQVDLVPDR